MMRGGYGFGAGDGGRVGGQGVEVDAVFVGAVAAVFPTAGTDEDEDAALDEAMEYTAGLGRAAASFGGDGGDAGIDVGAVVVGEIGQGEEDEQLARAGGTAGDLGVLPDVVEGFEAHKGRLLTVW